MNNELEKNLFTAIERCNGRKISPLYGEFETIYPFTNENVNGYIDKFSLKDKSLLTVGSSGDQAINAIYMGCKDVTLLDINPFVKYYYFLKVTSMFCLDMKTYFAFLKLYHYPKLFAFNSDAFNKKLFDKIAPTLYELDAESYYFWNLLFNKFDSNLVRESLFSSDEFPINLLKECNRYLKDEERYYTTREKLKSVTPKFIIGDLFTAFIGRKYDNIWLSSIGPFLKKYDEIKKMTDKMAMNLNQNGLLLISYLYRTNKDTEYETDWASIYNLKKVYEILNKYDLDLYSFIGTVGLKKKDPDIEDSILLYRKR